jgi:hypothetical protein
MHLPTKHVLSFAGRKDRILAGIDASLMFGRLSLKVGVKGLENLYLSIVKVCHDGISRR